jgi:DNA-binding response OmpR family regulator
MARRRILLVHDEPEFTDAVKRTLSELGFEVEVAIDPGDAISRLLTRMPDAVCVHLNLPRGSGYDVCDFIRGDASLQRLPILVMSDRQTPEELAYAEEAGANVFLSLPSPSRGLASLGAYLRPLVEGASPTSAPNLFQLRSTPPPSGP